MTAPAIPTPSGAPSVPGIYWNWRGQSIYYLHAARRDGSAVRADRAPLLLVHGFGASTDHWRKNVAELREDFEIWAIDLLGFGRSSKPNWAYSGQLWQEQLQEFVREVVGRPVVVAGNSLGGYVALCLGANCPEWVAGVILLNSAGPFSESPEAPQRKTPLQATLQATVRSLFLQPWASYTLFQWLRQPWVIRRTLEQVYVDRTAVTDRLVEEIYWPSCDVGAPQVFASVFKTPQGDPVDRLLERLQHPLLLIWGEGDPWMKASERSQKFRQYAPQATEVFLAAGHCPHDEDPVRTNAAIRDWMLAKVTT